MRPHARHRGIMLLEVLLAVVLFVGAASFCLAAVSSLFTALDRAQRRQLAVDLARSKLAELEAGLTTLQDLRGRWSGAVGSRGRDTQVDAPGAQQSEPAFFLDVATSSTAFTGLTLVELTVRPDDPSGPAFTLRQLMSLGQMQAEAYDQDELASPAPEGEP